LEVVLLSYTSDAEKLCAACMRSTRTKEPAHELMNKLWRIECQFATRHGWKLDRQFCEKCDYKKWCVPKMLIQAKQRGHWGVFEHANYTFSVSGISRSCTHQLVRHRMASYLQQSLRAVVPTKWKLPQSMTSRKLGSEKYNHVVATVDHLFELYRELVDMGVPEEDARFILPIGTKTHIVVKMNARSLLHFFKLRLSKHAQWEIREMAQKMLEELNKVSPLIFEGAGELNV